MKKIIAFIAFLALMRSVFADDILIHPNLLGIRDNKTIFGIQTSLGNPGLNSELPTAKAVRDAISAIPTGGGSTAPTGSILLYAGSSAPVGWLILSGDCTLSRTTYSALFAIIGTIYGYNSEDTFCLPDLRGRFPVGVGQQSGGSSYTLASTGGEEKHVLTIPEIPAHDHSYVGPTLLPNYYYGGATYSNIINSRTGMTGGGLSHENRPPFLALNFIIKY